MDSKNAALHRLLSDAQQGGQAKVDALIALAQRTLWVVSWPKPEDGYRTLVSSDGKAALPVFTERGMLDTAARRFGWVAADGSIAASEVGARQALAFARDRDLAFVVVDIVADHSLEVAQSELQPLLTPAARRESQGAFSGTGRISTALMQSVRGTPAPGSVAAVGPIRAPTPPPGSLAPAGPIRAPTPPPGSLSPARPAAIAPPPGSSPGTLRATSPVTTSAVIENGDPSPIVQASRLQTPTTNPDHALVDRLDAVLRNYPEVEWACIGLTSSGATVIGLRIDLRMRSRLDGLRTELGRVSRGMPITLLDDPAVMRAARIEAFVFFPWKKKSTGTFSPP